MTEGRAVLMEQLTWPQVAKLVEGGEQLCLLPVGALEQHGRHLPAGTDSTIAGAICGAVSARTRVPVLPVLWATSSQAHTTKWPGTFALTPRLLIEVVVQLADWVRASGFTKLLVVNAHGGNITPGRMAIYDVQLRHRDKPDLWMAFSSWWTIAAEQIALPQLDQKIVTHACELESSMILRLRPELVGDHALGRFGA